jgi:hypothetical protein
LSSMYVKNWRQLLLGEYCTVEQFSFRQNDLAFFVL